MAHNLEPTSFQLTIVSQSPAVDDLSVMFDRIFVPPADHAMPWQAQMMVAVRAKTPADTKALLVRRLREVADDIEHAEIVGP
jgi:hypothetical protein